MITHIASLIKPEDKPGTIYVITIGELCRVCGWDASNGWNYQDIKTQLDAIDRQTKWIKQDDGREVRFRWFDRLEMERLSGTITVSFHYTIEPYLYGVEKRFTQYISNCIYAMKSRYSKYLYEWLKSFEAQRQIAVSLEDFSRYVCPNEYTEFKSIKQRILDTAIKEINEMSDITVKCVAQKKIR
jgi:plasmid replication initiation protein